MVVTHGTYYGVAMHVGFCAVQPPWMLFLGDWILEVPEPFMDGSLPDVS